MTTIDTLPRLEGCDVLPPLVSGDHKQSDASDQQPSKRKSRHGKTAGRFAVLNTFIDFTIQSLTRNEIAVWLILYRDTRADIASTSQQDIARRAGIHRRTVSRARKRLEKLGLVKIVYRGGLNQGISKYRIRPLPKDG